MVCVDYNIIKEGFMRNATISGGVVLSDVQLQSLYDGSYGTSLITISGTGSIVGLLQNFGETYDVCYVRYYTDDVSLLNISGEYSTFSGTEASLTWYLESSGVYRADINSQLRNLEIVHTISSGINTNIYQLDLIPEENSTLGFGDSPVEDIDYFKAFHATDQGLSSSASAIPVFNDNPFDEVAKVAVSPTFTEEDDYVFLATSKYGVYYGINDYGVKLPGHKKSNLISDPLSSGTLSNQWYLRTPPSTHLVTRNAEGITFEIGDARYAAGVASRRASGLLSSEDFTVQSFTAEIKVKLDNYIPYTDVGSAIASRTIMFILTNGFAIPDIGYNASQTTRDRVGGVSIGMVMSGSYRDGSKYFDKDDVRFRVRLADGNSLDDRSGNIDDLFPGISIPITTTQPRVEVAGPSISELEDINFEGVDFEDYTLLSRWRTWKITYDHVKRELKGYIDNVFIGSVTIKAGNLSAGTRMFIGQHGDSNQSWAFKDFEIEYDNLYKQENSALDSTASATISGTEVYKVIDGDTSIPYVGPNPDVNSNVRITFDSPKDITSYTIKQRDKDTLTSAYGIDYYPDVARTALVDFGGKFTEVHSYPSTNGIIQRTPTFSGTAVVASGIDYINFNYIEYDETVYSNGALVIEQIEVFSESTDAQSVVPPEEDNTVPWTEGIFHNTKIYGSDSSISLRDKEKIILVESLPEYAIEDVNYGFSSAALAEEYEDNYIDSYHNATEIFYPTYHSDGGDYQEGGQHAWWSGPSVAMPVFAWQVFDEECSINSVYWSSDNFHTSRVVADKFKFQYLTPGGSPLIESDWADIPTVTTVHPYGSEINDADQGYQEYKDYLIANNDGEYYTDYEALTDASVGIGFTIGNASFGDPPPKGLPIPDSYMETEDPQVRMYLRGALSRTNSDRGYVHFDESIRTRGLRMVVDQAKSITTGSIVNEFGLVDIFIFRDYSVGSYTSPVFDTGTPQNTERLSVIAENRNNTSVKSFVRSSATSPEYSHNNKYEFWESAGEPGNSQVPVTVGTNTSTSVQVVGDIIYLFLSEPFAYNILEDTWAIIAGGYPDSVAAASNIPTDPSEEEGNSSSTTGHQLDSSVRPMTALIGSKVYVAAKTTGNATVPRLMYYDPSTDLWNFISGNRPTFAEDCSMVASQSQEDLYFFNEDGTISRYNISAATWQIEDATIPRFGDKGCTVQLEGKIYIFGGKDGTTINGWGTGSNVCFFFDEATKTVSSISPSPYNIYKGNAVLVEEHKCIYILPFTNASSSYDAPQKYFYEEDRWEVVESLLSFREMGADPGGAGISVVYYKHDKHIYGVGGTTGRKVLVVHDGWESGRSPSFKDTVWGSKPGLDIPWLELGTFGEFMPQERYFQFKTELESLDLVNSPVLKSVTVVQPQSLPIPASGTSNIYVKVGAIPDKTFRVWYSAYDAYSTDSPLGMFYSSSPDRVGWSYGTTVSGVWDSSDVGQPSDYYTTSSIWSIKDDDGSYEHWFSSQEAVGSNNLDDEFSIRYSPSAHPDYISGDVLSVPTDELSESATGATHPCVIKNSPSSYDMWYSGFDSSGVKRIIHTSSTDGESWTSHAVVVDLDTNTSGLDSVHAYRPSVIKEGSLYKMWYTGIDSYSVGRILYTESADGLSWDPSILVVSPGDHGEEASDSVTDCVVASDGTQYVMLYVGVDGSEYSAISAVSPDGLTWSDHIISIPGGSLSESQDSSGPRSVFIIIDVENTTPSTVFSSAKIKLHNEGPAL
jgi:hypothetical protein